LDNPLPTCRVADVEVHHVLLVDEKHPEILAAGCQHSFVGLEVDAVHHEGAVAQQTQLPLLVQLLQDLLAVLGKIHGCGGTDKPQEGGETGAKTPNATSERATKQDHRAMDQPQPDCPVN